MTLIDHRPAMLTPGHWPDVDSILVRSPADIAVAVDRADCDAAVVMNHHYERDLEFLAAWLGSVVPFIGMLGPRHRTQQMITTLDSNGILLEGGEQRTRSPVGLDLGGETPEEIALSIVAEVQAVYAGRQAGFLTQRRSPLHSRPAAGLKESVTRL